MKLIHLSDLHLGKRLNEFSLQEDQEYILTRIINIIDEEKPEAVIIAGDIYDRSVPNTDAVELFDDFLYRLARKELHVFIISGNHDSPERLAFGNRIIDKAGIHISPVYNGSVVPVTLNDSFGPVNFYMLPFVKPANVRRFFEDDITSYTDAIRTAVKGMNMNMNERNVLITHQNVSGAYRSESEEFTIGGTDAVDADVFDGIDYVALGHIHGPQNIGSERIRYCGSPLKYSFSEVLQEKCVSIAELGEKGELSVRTAILEPRHDMKEIRGNYDELMRLSYYEKTPLPSDYLHITLTDENDIPNAFGKLSSVYKNLMKLDYDNTRTRTRSVIDSTADVETKSPLELFDELYEKQNGQHLNEKQTDFLNGLIEKIWGDKA